jgi:hypothetical protein
MPIITAKINGGNGEYAKIVNKDKDGIRSKLVRLKFMYFKSG